ncbi:ABC transporter ATP-binding protein [Fictibacillus sp. Mic-4]|uniref:ABC transporter ATP-binding protein n=1 Tax=Fictibacillus sp. Mic-4 TaxID=3132826 RepID=UPI003CEC22AC
MIIEVSNLVKRYKDFLALDHMTLAVKEGEVFGLLGPNGAGKSTLVHTMLGLTKYDSGEIKLLGKSIKQHELEIKEDIGLVPQDIALYEELTADENVTLFGKLYGLKGEDLKNGVKEALEFVGLYDMKDKQPGKFSGGMKRRLNIACAIVHKPKLIIMDEPTVGIDPQSRNYILESVKKLNEMGSTIIYISHYMEEVAAICTNIAIVDKGRIIAQGTKNELAKLIINEHVVVITMEAPNYAVIEKLKELPVVKEVTAENETLRIVTESPQMNEILELFIQEGVKVTNVATTTPTLEDVFLTLTGRALREEA